MNDINDGRYKVLKPVYKQLYTQKTEDQVKGLTRKLVKAELQADWVGVNMSPEQNN